MTDALAALSIYGYLVRVFVDFVKTLFGISGAQSPRLVRIVTLVASAAFVYGLNLNPVALLGLGKLKLLLDGAAAQPIGVVLLAGASMGMNDLIDLVSKLGVKR